ncbi:MAG TPA: hypothetical protein VF719_02640, partial [Abditibacteriaceae bacterium]
MLALYSITIFLSAALLFGVQPLFARMVLPLLGGSPAVWNTALVFYQAVLLAGYAYAHASTTKLGVRRQAGLHLVILALPLSFLPIAIPSGWTPPTQSNPAGWMLMLMLVAVGPSFFAVSTSSPVLQKWFAATGHRTSADPYFLYAASNFGSMIALLAYPFWIEPRLRLAEQSRIWMFGYWALLLLMAGCAVVVWKTAKPQNSAVLEAGSTSENAASDEKLEFRRVARWVALSFAPSSLMIGVTTYLSNEIASIPLLWIVPLVIYLLSFILVFAKRVLVPHSVVVRAFAILVLPLAVALTVRAVQPMSLLIPLHLLVLFLVAMMCHGEIARDRPAPQHLTAFYLTMSAGGVLGGIFNALLAPQLFSSVAEYPIVLAVACALMPAAMLANSRTADACTGDAGTNNSVASRQFSVRDVLFPLGLFGVTVALVIGVQNAGMKGGPLALSLMFGPATLVCFSFSRRPLRFALGIGAILLSGLWFRGEQERVVLLTERSFFGVHRVGITPSGDYRQLVHGNTMHGMQSLDAKRAREPLSYYYRTGPIGQVFQTLGAQRLKNVAVVGLGVGSLAAYGEAGQKWVYFEIDPVVERIARNDQFFTYLRDCRAEMKVVLGDARQSMIPVARGQFDLIVLDAYSSD